MLRRTYGTAAFCSVMDLLIMLRETLLAAGEQEEAGGS